MHFTDTVNLFRVEENTLRCGRFTSINVSDDTNISCFFREENL